MVVSLVTAALQLVKLNLLYTNEIYFYLYKKEEDISYLTYVDQLSLTGKVNNIDCHVIRHLSRGGIS